MLNYIPERGDLVWINFTPQAGHEQEGKRPALVISPAAYNKQVGLALFCPITNQIKGYPFEVLIPKEQKTSGAILSDQLRSLDWKVRKAKFIEKLPLSVLEEVQGRITTLIE